MNVLKYGTLAVSILALISGCKESETTKKLAQLDPPETSKLERTADSLFQTAIDSSLLAGGEVLVYKAGDTLLRKTYGKASIELGVPMPENAMYEIASVTKQFTAAAILKLVEEGKLSLYDPMTDYIDFDTQGYDVRIHHLLNHTSGIFQQKLLPDFWNIVQRPFSKDSILTMTEAAGMMFPPGEAQFYNDSAYFILGMIIEKLSGQSYEDYLDDTFFSPLGMHNTNYCSNDRIEPNKAYGYDYKDGKLQKHELLDHSWPYAAGSLCSTAEDLLIWMEALHNGKVLSKAAYEIMITPTMLHGWRNIQYNAGLDLTEVNGYQTIGHLGGIPGYSSSVRYLPTEDLYIIILLNTRGSLHTGELVTQLQGSVLPTAKHLSVDLDVNPKDLNGTYCNAHENGPECIKITVSENGLVYETAGGKNEDFSMFLGENTWKHEDKPFLIQIHHDSLALDYISHNYLLIKDQHKHQTNSK
ncbi:serine hydrolase domain-containing protein [Robertkochia flava]|uniref:serine hydrolase domain-containing protein n=1 Tax=Robertkochia flava TaxID=3447986 RepID=UPI001CCA3A46|nr:serine hydrolase domain-containing protein [Robertkochia marina]